MSKVSVIVPVYNAEKYLREAIESVLNQTYTDFELLLINDRSTDKSKEICEEYSKKDERIILLENDTENHGPGPTRNIGLDNATGDFIYFMDADDWIDKTLLETCIDRMRETNADIVQVGVEYRQKDPQNPLQIYHKGNCLLTKDDIKNDFLKFWNENSFMIWQQFFTSEAVKGIRLEKMKTGEDICYVMDAFCNAEKIAYIPKALYHYRYVQGSTCHSWNENNIECIKERMKHRNKFLNVFKDGIDKAIYSRIIYGDYYWEIYQLSSSFCPLSYREKKKELSKFGEIIEFNKYRRIYPIKLQHGIDKIYCVLIKCHLEWIILMFRAALIKLLKGE